MAIEYTVVFLVPDYACSDAGYGQDIFVSYVLAEDERSALDLARREAFNTFDENKEEGGSGINDPLDFGCLVIFSGHAPIACFGWQL